MIESAEMTNSPEYSLATRPSFDVERNHILVAKLLEEPHYQDIGWTRKINPKDASSPSHPNTISYLREGAFDFVVEPVDSTRILRVGPFNKPGFTFSSEQTLSIYPALQPSGSRMRTRPITLWETERTTVERLVETNDPLGALLATNLLISTLSYQELLETKQYEASNFDLPSRIAAHILTRADNGVLYSNHQNIADYLGVFRETVTEKLIEFQDQRIVSQGYGTINIEDTGTLNNLAFELLSNC